MPSERWVCPHCNKSVPKFEHDCVPGAPDLYDVGDAISEVVEKVAAGVDRAYRVVRKGK